MPSRKRSLEAACEAPPDDLLLKQIRSMWQFANLCQWIYTFGKAAKIDESIDIEEIETECLKPNSTLLSELALALLKLISSHRGLTHEIFDSQARKQYLDKAPHLNPFGDDETPRSFQGFDVFTKVRVLQQMTQWTMIRPERIREKMDEQKDVEQTNWRIEPYGWDREDRTYFVLDDNRVYRLTEAPAAPPPKPKKRKSFRTGQRSSKRRRTETDARDRIADDAEPDSGGQAQDDSLGGMTWECLAVTLNDVRLLVDSFQKTRDENEKILRKQLEDHLVPILEKQEESRNRKALQRERELLNLAKMANAKRSSRIASKLEQQKQEEKTREELQQLRQAEEAERREEKNRLKKERERDFRMASRGQRLKEREARRLQHEEELAQLSEDSRHLETGTGRVSERRLQAEIERNKQALKEIEDEDEDWVFDCSCGLYGQVDDGAHSVACEKCNVWQHSKCLGISEGEAERSEFHFICGSCRHREEAQGRSRATIKLKVNRPAGSSSQHESAEGQSEKGDVRPVPESTTLPKLPDASVDSPDIPSSSHRQHLAPSSPEPQQTTSTNLTTLETPQQEKHVDQTNPSNLMQSQGFNETAKKDASIHNSVTITSLDETASSDKGSTRTTQAEGNQVAHGPEPLSASGAPAGMLDQTHDRPPAADSSLCTPAINREIYRAAHVENGNLPAQGGLSPTKHSPYNSFASASSNGTTTTKIPSGITLSPSPREPILTPPTKHAEPLETYGRH